ncbi:MAG: MFS transporter [Pseudomonadota bacterium]|nr:MFS transporter [Pseudomonadota bacterium]
MTQPAVPASRLAGFYFGYFALIGAFMPYWNLYLEHLGFEKAVIGLLATITVFTRIVAPSVWGYLADHSGQRMRWVRLGALAQLLAWCAVLVLPNTLFWLAVILFFFSFFQNAILAQFEAVTLFWLGEARERYGMIRLWGSLGFIAAVFGLGWWLDLTSVLNLPWAMVVLALATLLCAWWIAEPPQRLASTHQLVPIRQVLQQRQVWLFFVVQFLLLFSHAPFYSFYSNYLQDFGYSTRTIGLLWAIGVFAEVLMFTQSHRVLAWGAERWLLFSCLALTALRWVLVGYFPNHLSMQIVAQCLHAFSFALFQSLAMRLIFREFNAHQQGRAQALYSMMWGLGVALGSLLAGLYWDRLSGSVIFYIAGGIAALAALSILCLPERSAQQNVPKPA